MFQILLLSLAEGHKFSVQVPLYQIPITAWVIQDGCGGDAGEQLDCVLLRSAGPVTRLEQWHTFLMGAVKATLSGPLWLSASMACNSKHIPARSQANTEPTVTPLHVLGQWLFLASQETDSDRILDRVNRGQQTQPGNACQVTWRSLKSGCLSQEN